MLHCMVFDLADAQGRMIQRNLWNRVPGNRATHREGKEQGKGKKKRRKKNKEGKKKREEKRTVNKKKEKEKDRRNGRRVLT
jgi:hypothetical protein